MLFSACAAGTRAVGSTVQPDSVTQPSKAGAEGNPHILRIWPAWPLEHGRGGTWGLILQALTADRLLLTMAASSLFFQHGHSFLNSTGGALSWCRAHSGPSPAASLMVARCGPRPGPREDPLGSWVQAWGPRNGIQRKCFVATVVLREVGLSLPGDCVTEGLTGRPQLGEKESRDAPAFFLSLQLSRSHLCLAHKQQRCREAQAQVATSQLGGWDSESQGWAVARTRAWELGSLLTSPSLLALILEDRGAKVGRRH